MSTNPLDIFDDGIKDFESQLNLEFKPPETAVMSGSSLVGGTSHSKYVLNIPSSKLNEPEIYRIYSSGKRVEDLTQEELRKVYHFIVGTPLNKVYSASALNHIAKYGRFPEDKDHEETDSLFTGTAIHESMETNGKNISNMATYSQIGEPPSKPEEVAKITSDNEKILSEICQEDNAVKAYVNVKNNKTVTDVTLKELNEYYEGKEGFEPSKALQKLINAAAKEKEKIKSLIPVYKKYLKELSNYNTRKQRLKSSGKLILDELPYRKMSADRMMSIIERAYQSMRSNTEFMSIYRNGYKEDYEGLKMEHLTEFVLLWEYEYKEGKTVACKSMFDRVHVDYTNKVVIIQDIKTHSNLARQFVSRNYFDYGYFRSMSFYQEAFRYWLKKNGEDPSSWNIYAILLPVSTVTFETGCFNPVVNISEIDLNMGKYGGYIKPIGTKFNIHGQAQWGLSEAQFESYAKIGIIHKNAYEYYIEGWHSLLIDEESKKEIPS